MSVNLILWANMLGAASCVARLGWLYVKTNSKVLKKVTRMNILFASLYMVIFFVRITHSLDSLLEFSIIVSILVWPLVWTRPSVILFHKIQNEMNDLQEKRHHVDEITKRTGR